MASASTQQLRTLQFQDLLSLSLSHASHESHLVLSVGNVVSCAGMLLRKPLIAVKGLHGTRFRYNVSILDKSMNDRDEWKLVTLSSLCDPSSYRCPLRSTFGKKRKLDESIASWKVIRREFLPMFFLLREINSRVHKWMKDRKGNRKSYEQTSYYYAETRFRKKRFNIWTCRIVRY